MGPVNKRNSTNNTQKTSNMIRTIVFIAILLMLIVGMFAASNKLSNFDMDTKKVSIDLSANVAIKSEKSVNSVIKSEAASKQIPNLRNLRNGESIPLIHNKIAISPVADEVTRTLAAKSGNKESLPFNVTFIIDNSPSKRFVNGQSKGMNDMN